MLIFATRRLFILSALLLLPATTGCVDNALKFNLVTQNLNRFFDDRDDGNREKVLTSAKYNKRVKQLINKITHSWNSPDIMAFQEIENINILHHIENQLESNHQQSYQSILLEGNDQSGIDVGFLISDRFKIKSVNALFKNKTYNANGAYLFSRPPLLIEVCADQCINIVNVHLRSMRGLKNSKKSQRVRTKRLLQSQTMAKWIEKFQVNNPRKHLIVTGDLNALSPSDKHVDVLGTLTGKPDQIRPALKSKDLISSDLIDISQRVSPKKRYSYLYKRNKQQLDYILVNESLTPAVQSVKFTRIDYRFSDHAALLAEFNLQ